MKASVIRKLSAEHSAEALDHVADLIAGELAEGESLPFEVDGEDDGERITHLMLASRIAAKVASGVPHKDAFREIMAEVRTVLTNS